MTSIGLRTTVAFLAFVGFCPAQSLNLDLGDSSAMGVPFPTYGAAADQPGEWNPVPSVSLPFVMMGLDGVTTSVVFTNASASAILWDHIGTTGDDEALLDDLGDPGISGQYRFDGLLPGGYELWTYAWAPDSDTAFTDVTVTGAAEPTVVVGGIWTGSHAEGVTYAVHHLNVSNGTILIDVRPSPGSNFASVNGFQLVYSGQVSSYCIGTGGAPCPCLNQAPTGARGGCRHGTGGWVELGHVGTSLVVADNLRLYFAGAPPNTMALFLQGTQGIEWPFKDGLLCIGNPTERLEFVQADFLGGGSTNVSIVNRGNVVPGDRRYYQLWYLDPQSGCGFGFNTSNALEVEWL